MRIFIKAKPNAKETSVVKIDETHYTVSVNEPPKQDRANHAIIRILADYFNIPTVGEQDSNYHQLSGANLTDISRNEERCVP